MDCVHYQYSSAALQMLAAFADGLVSVQEVCEVLALLGMSCDKLRITKMLCGSQEAQGAMLSVDSTIKVLFESNLYSSVRLHPANTIVESSTGEPWHLHNLFCMFDMM